MHWCIMVHHKRCTAYVGVTFGVGVVHVGVVLSVSVVYLVVFPVGVVLVFVSAALCGGGVLVGGVLVGGCLLLLFRFVV